MKMYKVNVNGTMYEITVETCEVSDVQKAPAAEPAAEEAAPAEEAPAAEPEDIASGTIDEQIMSALRKKEKTQSALIDAVKANLEV